jgi:hypothetical protein
VGLNYQCLLRIYISGSVFAMMASATANITYVPLQHHFWSHHLPLSRNNAEFLGYIQNIYYYGLLTTQQLDDIGLAYPDDITQVLSSFFYFLLLWKHSHIYVL